MKDKITIVTFTHYWTNAPSTELIDKTFDSLYSRLPLTDCRHIINYDMPENNKKYREYYNNLLKLKDKYNKNIEITTFSIKNKKRSYIYSDIVDTITTPYVILWEHDFVLLRDIDLESIINAMDYHEEINYIKFNKRINKPTINRRDSTKKTIDGWLEKEDRYEIPLLKTCGYSGSPHIERVSWFKCVCKKLIYTIPVNKQTSIERAINKWLFHKRNRFGEKKFHNKVGLYIYGNINDKPYVKEIYDYKSKEAWGNKLPSKTWRKINEK